MSEETESDLSDAIARHSALVHSMMENTPLELAHMATGSGSKKIQSIRRLILDGHAISAKQYYALAEYLVVADDYDVEYQQCVWGDYDLGE